MHAFFSSFSLSLPQTHNAHQIPYLESTGPKKQTHSFRGSRGTIQTPHSIALPIHSTERQIQFFYCTHTVTSYANQVFSHPQNKMKTH